MRRLFVGALLLVALSIAPMVLPAEAKEKAHAAAAPAANGGGIDFAGQKSGTPLEIYADQGLELTQDAKTVIGRVNAKAIRGNVTVSGDVLTAHYRAKAADAPATAPAAPSPTPSTPPPAPSTLKKSSAVPATVAPPAADSSQSGGSNEVWRVEADGHVSIATPSQAAYGDHADYNIDDAVVVLTGQNLKLVTPTDVVTARDSLEYWEHRNQAVARGNAVAVRGEKRIQADVLVADFAENSAKQMSMQRAHGYDHVILTAPNEIVTGDRADYNVETGIVTVTGSVKITRGDNQLDGGYAVVNMNTGISRIFPAAPGAAVGGDRRVKGLFVPQKKQVTPEKPGVPTDSSPAPRTSGAEGSSAPSPVDSTGVR